MYTDLYDFAPVGGDEFAVLLPQTTNTDEALLRMRQ
jgi:GGDEF domain-containing protein